MLSRFSQHLNHPHPTSVLSKPKFGLYFARLCASLSSHISLVSYPGLNVYVWPCVRANLFLFCFVFLCVYV